jgi:small subunit ribosomal protein S2
MNTAAIPTFTMRELLEAGVHFGHKTSRWNPRMAPYIYGSRNGVHIVNLQQTVPLLHNALVKVHEVVSKNGRVLFVGTKRQASDIIADEARRCGQYFVNHRWLGGMLTNWKTVSESIKVLKDIEARLEDPMLPLTKKERLGLSRQREKLMRSLGGIREMGGVPNLLVVIDINRESLAIAEARKLGIPVVAITDTNTDPNLVDFPIPGNDDAARAIALYARLVADTVLSGLQRAVVATGADIGESADLPLEALPGGEKPRVAKKSPAKKAPAKKAEAKGDEGEASAA